MSAAKPSRAPDDLLQGLNPAQVEAVTHAGGPLLILAGAGSGKTRVITSRVAWLASERDVAPREILAITFTNKAAGEMRARVEALECARGSWISTFHSLCARILRRDIGVLEGYTRDFSIYDTADRNALIKDLLKAAQFDTTRFKPAAVGAWISDAKNRYITASDALLNDPGGGIDDEVFERIAANYESAMRDRNALDFDDLLLKVLEIFERHPGVRDGYARRFRHVMVDEYQDTNRVQYLLMRHLAGFHNGLTVCGDPDQSIYAWRGADLRNILDFELDFPRVHVVRLEQNYRSSGNILAAAQAVIRHNLQRKEKELWSDRGPGELLVLRECADEDDEAREIAFQIRALERAGKRRDEIAIFYRVNFMQRALERALRLARIPYQIVAGTEFYQRREVKDLIAYLKLIVNPRDDEAAKRVINVPARGVGQKSVVAMANWAQDRRLPLLSAAASSELRGQIRGRAKAALAGFTELMVRLTDLRDAPALEVIERVIESIGYYGWIERNSEQDDVDRAANVDELRSHAEAYDRLNPEGGLRGFLQDIALVSDSDAYEEGQAKVAMMTMHAAKGLEFPVVFIAGLEEELLPHARAIAEGSADDLGIEEERRLFYVGMTRAKERLLLTHARIRRHFGQDHYAMPSRFIDEIPPELIGGFEGEADEDEFLGDYEPETEAGPELARGDWVEHSDFGIGRVLLLRGAGVNARATVAFSNYGEKQLLLAYAKLRRLRGAGS
jgi:DNA helicase-2/ATP-dependent DNA helicase PcrA